MTDSTPVSPARPVLSERAEIEQGFVEPVSINEVLVDGLASVTIVEGLPRLSFFVLRPGKNPGDRSSRVLVARLAMSVGSAARLSKALDNTLAAMEADGWVPNDPKDAKNE